MDFVPRIEDRRLRNLFHLVNRGLTGVFFTSNQSHDLCFGRLVGVVDHDMHQEAIHLSLR